MQLQPPIFVDMFIVSDESSHESKERQLQEEGERQL